MGRNLFELYQHEISGNESVLDVGCGGLEDLVCFEDAPFEILHGVDRDLDYPFDNYSNSRTVINQKKPLSFAEFQKRYKLKKADIKDYDFGMNRHNFIICRNVLHFFPDPEKFDLVERMYTALAPGGLLYLQLYHTTNQHIIDNYIHLGMNVYASEVSTDKYYLTDQYHFTEEVENKYAILTNEVQRDAQGFRFAIKKW